MAAPKQGGFKMSLGPLKAKAGLKASPLQKDAKRPRLALGDDEPDDLNKQQEILGWDAAKGGALDAGGKKEKEGPRIIPALPNRDWRAEARRKQLAKAPHQQAQSADKMEIEKPKAQYGLTIIKKDEPQEGSAEESTAPQPIEVEQDNLTEEQRLEKKALDALLNGKTTDNELVIPVQTLEEAFLNDLYNAPDAPTLEAYEATPIEGFGAALLRGMGWKDDDAIGNNGAAAKPKEVKRRPALLGIGAKEEAAVGIEFGEWGGKGKGKGKKVAQSYNPVTLRNKHTGELITEEELKAKLESQDLVKEKPSKERRSKYDDDGEGEEDVRMREKRRDRQDDRNRDRDRRHDDDYDSERRKDSDRKSDRRRDKDDYYDSDRRRDKRRDKGRDYEYDSERRKEKHRDRGRDEEDDGEGRNDKRKDRDRRGRSRSPDSERKIKRRDRYRSRSRDIEDRRERGKDRERLDRSRSRDSDDRRKRRRDRGYDDDRNDRKKRYKDERYYK